MIQTNIDVVKESARLAGWFPWTLSPNLSANIQGRSSMLEHTIIASWLVLGFGAIYHTVWDTHNKQAVKSEENET
jgi:hypothetical protein